MSDDETYRVRNTYGYIEHLTAQEIANLRERGEHVEIIDEPTSTSEDLRRKGKVIKGIFSVLFAVHGAYAEPSQSSNTTQHKWSEGQMRGESRRRGDSASDATRDKGQRSRESGQQ